MKKVLIVVALIICLLMVMVFSSCKLLRWLSDDWLTVKQKTVTSEAIARLCKAINRRDASGVKAEFSLYEISEVGDFDESVNKLFDYINGDIVKYEFLSSGMESADMGDYPRQREFDGVVFSIETDTDTYKVNFGYRSHYSISYDKVLKERIGFKYFDIINCKDDRICDDRYYSGCPFYYMGINIGYKTSYKLCPEGYGFNTAYSDEMTYFEPLIINSIDGLDSFYEDRKATFNLENRSDGKGFKEVVSKYDDAFFEMHSLFLVGEYNENGGCAYYPQFVYIDDFVLVDIAIFIQGQISNDPDEMYEQKGVIIIIELPEKVSDDIKLIERIRNPYKNDNGIELNANREKLGVRIIALSGS